MEVVRTIPQEERFPKLILEQIVALTYYKWQEQIVKDSENHATRWEHACPASREHSGGEDAQHHREDEARREG